VNRIQSRLSRIGWNKRILTQADFDRHCSKEGVRVIDCPMKWDGLYLCNQGRPVIVLNDKLQGADRLYVQWHELAHHLLHLPQARFFLRGFQDRAEYQAHLIAACALIPRRVLLSKTEGELLEEYGYRPQIVRFRWGVWKERKI
jgi:Zn-dependent peptidase ImmA (M78 family)